MATSKEVIGQRIQTVRKHAKHSQSSLAKAIGIDKTTLKAYESGEASPTYDTLELIAIQCNINPIYFSLGGTIEQFSQTLNNLEIAHGLGELPHEVQHLIRIGISAMIDKYWKDERSKKIK
jgi:transcriptional regulator with XRE-family HTH domain